MKKYEFLARLERRLQGLPDEDVKRTLDYYAEMIDDRIEDGGDEDLAVEEMGNVEDISRRIWSESSSGNAVKGSIKRARKMKTWEIILLIVGSPVWLSLLLAAAVVIVTLYAVLWAVVVSFYAIDLAFVGVFLEGITLGVIFLANGGIGSGLCWLGIALVFVGVGIFAFFGCHLFARLSLFITKKPILYLKSLIGRRREKDEEK